MLTYFVVQAYTRTRMGALATETPMQAQDEGHAVRLAVRLSVTVSGVVAFRRRGNPATGEYEDAEILAYFGEVPGLDQPVRIAC